MARLRGRGCLLVVSLVLVAGFIALFVIDWYVRSELFPAEWREAVKDAAAKQDLDPLLVAAVVFRESRFDTQAVSKRDARGLMQVLPSTGEEIAAKVGHDNFDAEALFDAETNLDFGCYYLAGLAEEFDGDMALALAAYNAGRENVKAWRERSNGASGAKTVAEHGFPETREYVADVMNAYRYLRLSNALRRF